MTTLDIIVPCYKYGHFLRECVGSVLNQAGPSVRVLIIDDASPDASAEIASEIASSDSRVVFVRHEINRGHIETYNEGIEWVSAKYMLLLSADDYLLPGALSRATELLDMHPEMGFAFGKAQLLSEDGSFRPLRVPICVDGSERRRVLTGKQFFRSSGATNIVPTPTAVVRVELLKRLGGYRPELPHTADMEMWWRLAARSSVGFVDEWQAVYRRHTQNMSQEYRAQKWLPDIQQRKLCLDTFFEDQKESTSDISELRLQTYQALGRELIGLAGEAFADGEFDLVEQLESIAGMVDPKIRHTWAWKKFMVKRYVGRRVCCAVRAARIRQTESLADASRCGAPE